MNLYASVQDKFIRGHGTAFNLNESSIDESTIMSIDRNRAGKFASYDFDARAIRLPRNALALKSFDSSISAKSPRSPNEPSLHSRLRIHQELANMSPDKVVNEVFSRGWVA
jgi:hypothetical protein